uniref:Uncharacterized protein n=1 Tax=Schistosoma curassoni TaxID=6186 RepID=A0A183KAE6_9TREM
MYLPSNCNFRNFASREASRSFSDLCTFYGIIYVFSANTVTFG